MKKVPKMTIILYICATLMALCTMFIIYKSNAYISGLAEQGFDPSKEKVEVINYYLSTVTPFAFYTISIFSLGYVINKINCLTQNQNVIIENNELLKKEEKSKDDEIDDFFYCIE